MSTTTKPVWRTATAHKEDDFDAIWLYENAWEWTFSEENGVVTLHYLSTKVMPERKGASPVSETPTHCRICGQEAICGVLGVCKTCWEAGAHLKVDLEQEKPPTKLDHQRGKMRVLSDDISYLISRIEHGSLASIAEHYEVQEEIHELQHILADWDSYIGMEIAKYAAQLAIDGMATQIKLQTGERIIPWKQDLT